MVFRRAASARPGTRLGATAAGAGFGDMSPTSTLLGIRSDARGGTRGGRARERGVAHRRPRGGPANPGAALPPRDLRAIDGAARQMRDQGDYFATTITASRPSIATPATVRPLTTAWMSVGLRPVDFVTNSQVRSARLSPLTSPLVHCGSPLLGFFNESSRPVRPNFRVAGATLAGASKAGVERTATLIVLAVSLITLRSSPGLMSIAICSGAAKPRFQRLA